MYHNEASGNGGALSCEGAACALSALNTTDACSFEALGNRASSGGFMFHGEGSSMQSLGPSHISNVIVDGSFASEHGGAFALDWRDTARQLTIENTRVRNN
jgi:hypothetical protein